MAIIEKHNPTKATQTPQGELGAVLDLCRNSLEAICKHHPGRPRIDIAQANTTSMGPAILPAPPKEPFIIRLLKSFATLSFIFDCPRFGISYSSLGTWPLPQMAKKGPINRHYHHRNGAYLPA